MTRSSLLLLASLSLLGCSEKNALYCDDDSTCQNKSWEHFDPLKPECHYEGHFCYEGCQTDQDCQDTSKRYYIAGRPVCDPATHDCVSAAGETGPDGPSDGGPPDGAPDGPTKLADGQPCSTGDQCQSGHCTDGVCCNELCDGVCVACALAGSEGTCTLVPSGEDPRAQCTGSVTACDGACNGAGGCIFPGATTSCGAPTCAAGELTTYQCDGSGGCATDKQDCGGYVCDAAGTACKTSCANDNDCTGGFFCENAMCKNTLPLGSSCGTNPAACASGYCEDGVCCDKACTGVCEYCALSTSKGTCAPVPAAQDLGGDCPGDSLCGPGTCDGSGACKYDKIGNECKSTCTGGSETLYTCDATHQCKPGTPTPCTPYICQASTGKCYAGCKSHDQCVSQSVCDREKAHLDTDGEGKCVAPADVDWATAGGDLNQLIGSTVKSVVAVPAGQYTTPVTVAKTIKVIGKGNPTLDPSTVGPAVTVPAGASLVLQGVVVQGATGAGGVGVYCNGSIGNSGTLAVLESVVRLNEATGVSASYCDVTLRRDWIVMNAGGGVDLAKGKLVVVNNVVVENGKISTATFGGVALSPSLSTGNAFVNNTVANNGGTHIPSGGGVKCLTNVEVTNSIVYGNGSAPLQGCTASYSDIQGGASGGTNIDVNPVFDASFVPAAAQCFNSGNSSAPELGSLDIVNGPRVKGAAVDMGAYEVQ